MATNEELSALSGGVTGFAEGLMGTIKEDKDREAAASKYAAYMQLQRELAGNKWTPGSEVRDMALSLGVSDSTIQANIKPGQRYPTAVLDSLLNNLRAISDTSKKEKGLGERATAANATKRATAAAPKTPTWDPAKSEAEIIGNMPTWAGFKKGTPLRKLFKTKEEAQAAINQIRQSGEAAIRGANREADFEVTDPFEMTQEQDWWNAAQLKPQSLFRSKKRQGTPGAVPPPTAPAAAPPVAGALDLTPYLKR